MTDSKLKSLIECVVNILPGFGIAYISNLYILSLFSKGISNSEHFIMIQIEFRHTAISVSRSYVFRICFERLGEHENFYTLVGRVWK